MTAPSFLCHFLVVIRRTVGQDADTPFCSFRSGDGLHCADAAILFVELVMKILLPLITHSRYRACVGLARAGIGTGIRFGKSEEANISPEQRRAAIALFVFTPVIINRPIPGNCGGNRRPCERPILHIPQLRQHRRDNPCRLAYSFGT